MLHKGFFPPSFPVLFIGVVLFHLLFYGAGSFFPSSTPKVKKAPIRIYTYPTPQAPPPKKKASSISSKRVASSSPKASPQKKVSSQLSKKLFSSLNQIKNSLSLSEEKTSSASLTVPCLISVQETSASSREPKSYDSYPEKLAERLQEKVLLQEPYPVKLELVIHPNGSVLQIKILDSKSKKNERYLKKTLPQLLFPCFNEAAPKNFVIYLQNS